MSALLHSEGVGLPSPCPSGLVVYVPDKQSDRRSLPSRQQPIGAPATCAAAAAAAACLPRLFRPSRQAP